MLRDAEGGDPELILIGTGSEVSLCLEAADALEGVRVRVVSMPCMDTFARADEAYREQVLPRACRARIAVEAASPLGWDRWIGDHGTRSWGCTRFGESGRGQGGLRALRHHAPSASPQLGRRADRATRDEHDQPDSQRSA